MTRLAWLSVSFGLFVSAVIVSIIVYDVWAATSGSITVSEWCLETGRKHPWLVALLTAFATLPLGILIGHLWFPQHR